MKIKYLMRGKVYSDNKVSIKSLFKKYELKWVGNMQLARWENDCESVDAIFEREDGVTKRAMIVYTGFVESGLYRELNDKLIELGAKSKVVDDEELKVDIDKMTEERMQWWDMTKKPNVENMRNCRNPAPEGFIKLAIQDYEQKRGIEYAKVKKQVEIELGIGGE